MERKMKKLVAFYSLDGNTRAVADAIADEIGADTLEIKPVRELRAKGFWRLFLGGMSVALGRTPDLVPAELDAANYDLILIGTPVWAGSMTPPIKAFLAQTNLKHKAVALYCTCNSGSGNALAIMRKAAVGADVLGENEFAGVLRNPDEILHAARAWAREMLETLAKA